MTSIKEKRLHSDIPNIYGAITILKEMSGGDVAEMTALSTVGGGGGGGSAGGSSGPGSPTLNCHHPQTQFPQPRPERQRCRPTFPLLMGTVLLTLLGSAVRMIINIVFCSNNNNINL